MQILKILPFSQRESLETIICGVMHSRKKDLQWIFVSQLSRGCSSRLFLPHECWLLRSYSDQLKVIQIVTFQDASVRSQAWNPSDPAASQGCCVFVCLHICLSFSCHVCVGTQEDPVTRGHGFRNAARQLVQKHNYPPNCSEPAGEQPGTQLTGC